ncbi:DUF6099 family protein [Kitasatospora sp. NPDC059571]|uniref:DUF6099 family protein n=1 Tax=Kitasatospora sp. NPDC059571 TaxID=3346871 RepID=UPI0036CA7FF1
MDALRLIKTARHALAEARTVPDVLVEAWQAGLLTEAVGGRIADRETGELAALGQLLCDAGSHAAGCLGQPPDDPGGTAGWSAADWTGCGRAERLDDLGELEPVLVDLGLLLHEVAETLVVLACGADAEGLYWRCIDGVDSGSECKDLVAELLRTVRRANGAAAIEDIGAPADPAAAADDCRGSTEGVDGPDGRADTEAFDDLGDPGDPGGPGEPADLGERDGRPGVGPLPDRRRAVLPPLAVRLGPPAAVPAGPTPRGSACAPEERGGNAVLVLGGAACQR